jgi:predicted GIY-YIG superfamily endonuclease
VISASEQRTALYRFYDEHENLLYVGISNDPWRRWREHVYDKQWYPQA